MPKDLWWLCRARRPQAACRLYCFPHSGGAPGEFLRWGDHLPDIEVRGLQLPGRGRRFAEPGYATVPELVEALIDGGTLTPPFAFFGHSLGALVAFETARALRARGLDQPVWIFASAYPAPHIQVRRRPVASLTDDELIESVSGQYGDTFGSVRSDPELLAASLATFRADFGLLDAYSYLAEPPLDIPVTVLGGSDDDIEVSELAAWRSHCTARFDLQVLPGGHFYFRDQPDRLLRHITEVLTGSAELAGGAR